MITRRKPLNPCIVAALINYEAQRIRAFSTRTQVIYESDHDLRVQTLIEEYRKDVEEAGLRTFDPETATNDEIIEMMGMRMRGERFLTKRQTTQEELIKKLEQTQEEAST